MGTYKFSVSVMPRDGILDPQGRALENSLPGMGVTVVHGVRIGKRVDLEVEAEHADEARKVVDQLARDLIANPLVEKWEIEEFEAVRA
jgi:phosphoribosylformylglycinamidine synthase